MFSNKDGIPIAIAILVLVIGTATGNAYAMLGMAVAGLVLCTILYRWNSKDRAGLVVITATAAAVAFAAGIALSCGDMRSSRNCRPPPTVASLNATCRNSLPIASCKAFFVCVIRRVRTAQISSGSRLSSNARFATGTRCWIPGSVELNSYAGVRSFSERIEQQTGKTPTRVCGFSGR